MDEVYAPEVPTETNEQGFYRAEGSTTPLAAVAPTGLPAIDQQNRDIGVTWTAAEYSYQTKPTSWRLLWGGGVISAMIIIWFITRDFFPALAVGLGIGLLGVYGVRRPGQLTYILNPYGLTIGNKQYAYHDFRSFSVADDDSLPSIDLMPLKRFGLPITVHFEDKDAEQVLTYLSRHLPMSTMSPRTTDTLLKRLHF